MLSVRCDLLVSPAPSRTGAGVLSLAVPLAVQVAVQCSRARRDALLRGCPCQSSRGPRVSADKPRARWVPWRPWGRAEVFLCPQVCQHHPQPALPHPRQPGGRRAAGPGPAARQLPAQPRNRECRGSWGSSGQGWARAQPGKVLPGGSVSNTPWPKTPSCCGGSSSGRVPGLNHSTGVQNSPVRARQIGQVNCITYQYDQFLSTVNFKNAI